MSTRSPGSTRHPSSAPSLHKFGPAAVIALSLGTLTACGGGHDGTPGAAVSTPQSGLISPDIVATAGGDTPVSDAVNLGTTQLAGLTAKLAALVPDPGLLLMLVPDTQDMADPRVLAWMDAASELGVRIRPVTDAQFMALSSAPNSFAGLILPDGLHTVASNEVIAAISTYTQNGGKTMLVFDFGALTLQNGVPFYAVPKSRLSTLAGVDFVLYDALRDKTTGLGPVTAARSTMRTLLVPPGKSVPYTMPLADAFASSTASATTTAKAANGAVKTDLPAAVGISRKAALYLPVSTADPGGVHGFDPQQYSSLRYNTTPSSSSGRSPARAVTVDLGRAIHAPAVAGTTQATAGSANNGLMSIAATEPQHAYSGYLYGTLIYPSYVTQGSFGTQPGQTVLATSPQFGLVAGVNPVGAGQVLFVNLPLTYLKQRTDALMMHGFLKYFSRDMLQQAHLSTMPNGVAGMTYNWHLDSRTAQAPTRQLMALNVFNQPNVNFSMDMTAGPDTVAASDGLGWNLSNNRIARQILTTLQAAGHSIGSHGGWIHDFYGINASEFNQLGNTSNACANALTRIDNFEQCLVLNQQSVEAVTGKPSREYSAPQGNNPLWAMTWLENRGVVGAYFGGHTGLGATRQYRDGQVFNTGMWMFPVTPAGVYATFEEFQSYNVPQADVTNWYHELVDFNVDQNTSRLVYAHPPGAALWSGVITDLLSYTKSRASQFAWYTMPRLADFMTQRQSVVWSQGSKDALGLSVFTVTHPTSLKEMVWRLPKSRFANAPLVVSGVATVDTTDANFWLIKMGNGRAVVFRA